MIILLNEGLVIGGELFIISTTLSLGVMGIWEGSGMVFRDGTYLKNGKYTY